MEVWLKSSSKRFRLPVIPSEYTVTNERGDETVDITAIGEVDLAGNRKLKGISWSCFFPYEYDDGYCEYSDLRSPRKSVELIEQMMHAGPVKVIITGTPVKFWTRITSFEWGERDGSGDIYYSITFREHRTVVVTSSTVSADDSLSSGTSANTTTQRTPPETETGTVTVKEEGLSVSAIARRQTGSAKNTKNVTNKDGSRISSDKRANVPKSTALSIKQKRTPRGWVADTTTGVNGASTIHKSKSGTTHGGGGRKF